MTALDKLRDGGTAIGTFAMIDGTLSVEGLARAGFDFICLDRQHGLLDDATVWNQIVAIGKAGKACPWVRIPWNRPEDAMRALDGGATGIVAPMIGSRAEAEALVRACRYPPEGERSWGPIRAGMNDPVFYTETANESTFVAAMIETRSGFDNLEDIAATPGLDAIFVGPNDLSFAISSWQPGMPTHTDFLADLRRIAEVATAHGKIPGIHCADAAMARAARGWGYRFMTVGGDIGFMVQAAKATVLGARK